MNGPTETVEENRDFTKNMIDFSPIMQLPNLKVLHVYNKEVLNEEICSWLEKNGVALRGSLVLFNTM